MLHPEKMKSEIKIRVLSIDQGDDTIHFQGFFSNALCSTTLEFYGYSDEFQNFASKLTEFPKSTKDKVTYELGEKGDKWAYYLLPDGAVDKCNDPEPYFVRLGDTLTFDNVRLTLNQQTSTADYISIEKLGDD